MAIFEFSEHVSGGVEMHIEAESREDLLRACGSALCLYVRDVQGIEAANEYPVTVHGHNEKTACIALINELLLQMETRSVALARFECGSVDVVEPAGAGRRRQIRVRGVAYGEPADPIRHPVQRSVRAARLEGLRLRRAGGRLRFTCVLDA